MSIREILKKRPLIGKILGEEVGKEEVYRGNYFVVHYDTVDVYESREAKVPTGTLTYSPSAGVLFDVTAIERLEHLEYRNGELYATSRVPLGARKTNGGVKITTTV